MMEAIILLACGLAFAVTGIAGVVEGDARNEPLKVALGFLVWVMGVAIVALAVQWGIR